MMPVRESLASSRQTPHKRVSWPSILDGDWPVAESHIIGVQCMEAQEVLRSISLCVEALSGALSGKFAFAPARICLSDGEIAMRIPRDLEVLTGLFLEAGNQDNSASNSIHPHLKHARLGR